MVNLVATTTCKKQWLLLLDPCFFSVYPFFLLFSNLQDEMFQTHQKSQRSVLEYEFKQGGRHLVPHLLPHVCKPDWLLRPLLQVPRWWQKLCCSARNASDKASNWIYLDNFRYICRELHCNKSQARKDGKKGNGMFFSQQLMSQVRICCVLLEISQSACGFFRDETVPLGFDNLPETHHVKQLNQLQAWCFLIFVFIEVRATNEFRLFNPTLLLISLMLQYKTQAWRIWMAVQISTQFTKDTSLQSQKKQWLHGLACTFATFQQKLRLQLAKQLHLTTWFLHCDVSLQLNLYSKRTK